MPLDDATCDHLVARAAYRNPRLLEQARQMQRDDHLAFVAHFGSDTLNLHPVSAAGGLKAVRRC